jgi:hypothetical protein
MQEACKALRALDQRWLALSTVALGICRSVGRDAECSANCVVRTCFISPYEKKRPTVSSTDAVAPNSCRTGLDRRPAGCGQNRPCWIDPGFRPEPQPEYWTRAGPFAKPAVGDQRCFSWRTLCSQLWQWTLITGAATRRSIKRKADGRYAADLVLQLPARGAGSVALHSAFIGSTEHLVDAIARGYEVTVLR